MPTKKIIRNTPATFMKNRSLSITTVTKLMLAKSYVCEWVGEGGGQLGHLKKNHCIS